MTPGDRPVAVVVGGGLAGMTAALRLAEAGLSVTLVERRPRLGGLASSFQRAGLWVDNGQHIFLRCCAAYRGLLRRLGASGLVSLQRRLDLPVLALQDRGDTSSESALRLGRLRRTGLPGPLQFVPSLIRYPHLSAVDKAAVARAVMRMRSLDPADPLLDERSFGSWLREQGQSQRSVAALWNLVGMAALNAAADDVSLALAAMVFKTGLTELGGVDLGWTQAPLGTIHHDAASAALADVGVRVLPRTKVVNIELMKAIQPEPAQRARPATGQCSEAAVVDDNQARPRSYGLVLQNPHPGGPQKLRADVVVLAVPPDAAHRVLPAGAVDRPQHGEQLGSAPIVNMHVHYDRAVLPLPVVGVLGSPVQWMFDRTEQARLAGAGQYLVVSQSAAHDEITLPTAELRRRYLAELQRLLPAARTARAKEFFVTRERAATFAPAPGSARLRLPTRTRMAGLCLAGAWTATGWPATMEGAVRSGHLAADEALTALRRTPGCCWWNAGAVAQQERGVGGNTRSESKVPDRRRGSC